MILRSLLVPTLALGLALAAPAETAEPASDPVSVLAFENGRWWNGSSFVEGTVWSVDGVLRDGSGGAPAEIVDLGGGFVVPPLGDAHDHGLASPGFAEESRRVLSSGIFYVQNPNSIRSWTAAARQLAAGRDTVDVTYANGGLTSPGGHPIQIYERLASHLEGWTPERLVAEATVAVGDRDDLDRKWPEVLAAEPDLVKVYLERSEHHAARRDDPAFHGARGLDPALLPAVVARAREAGLRVSAHVTSVADFRTAVASGVDEIAHLPLEPLGDAEAAAAATAGVVVVTTTLSHRPAPEVEDLDALHRENLRLLFGEGVRIVLGTDSERTVLEEAENLVRLGVVTTGEAFRLLTVETPRWIFPNRAVGTLSPGSEASFLVLREDPTRDLGALRKIATAFKQGERLVLDSALPGIGQRLAHDLMRDGAEAAIAEYHRLRREESDRWDFSEGQLEALGRVALHHGRPADAAAIFAFNAGLFEGSAAAWIHLGDARAALGENSAAAESYRRALALAPGDEETEAKLRALERDGEG